MHGTLSQYVHALADAGELVRVAAPVSPVLEIAAIADRVSKGPAPNPPSQAARRADPVHADRGGPALLFENVEGSPWPVLINAYGSYRRMEMALGCEEGGFDAIAERIGALTKPELPRSFGEALAMARRFAPLLRIGPKRARTAACQDVVHRGDAIDLRQLPMIRCWPLDGDLGAVGYPANVNDAIPGVESGPEWDRLFRGRYITIGGVHTIHADDAGQARPRSHNIGIYRVQLLGAQTMAMHWHVHHDGAAHWRSWKRRGQDMPVAIALGGEPVLPYAATAPLPPGASELLTAGFLRGRGIPLVRCKTVPLRVPANAEIVIEGYVSHEAGEVGWDPTGGGLDSRLRGNDGGEPLGPGAACEGPFGDHTGFYSLPDRYPLLRVMAVTHRRKPIYPTTIVGFPPQEDYYLGKATERLFLPLLRVLIPDIEDYDLPMFGAFHNCVFVRISKQYALQARRVMHAIWGAGQMAWTKTIFVVDDDADVHDSSAVLRAASRWCDPRMGVERAMGPLDILDHAAPWLGAGGKMGFDCTRPLPGEGRAGERTLPGADARARIVNRVRTNAHVRDAAMPEALGAWLFVACADELSIDDLRQIDAPAYIALLGSDVDVQDAESALFHWVANADMARDAVIIENDHGRASILFDARPKHPGAMRSVPVRAWPPPMLVDDATRELVDRRWADYGIAGV